MHTKTLDLSPFVEKKPPILLWVGIFALVVVGGACSFFLTLLFLPADRLAPGTYIEGIPVGWQTRRQAESVLRRRLPAISDHNIVITWQEKNWTKTNRELQETWDTETAINTALQSTHTGNLNERWQKRWNGLWQKTEHQASTRLDPFATQQWIQTIAQEVDDQGERPRFIEEGGQTILETGRAGQEVIQEDMTLQVAQNPEQATHELLVAPINPPLSADGLVRAERRQKSWAGKTLEFTASPTDLPKTLTTKSILAALELPEGYHRESLENTLKNLLKDWELEPQDAQWKLSADQNRLETFVPHTMGRTVDWEKLLPQVVTTLTELENSSSRSAKIQTIFHEKAPQKTLKEVNDLGIEERVGYGVSHYAHSIPNRIFNVGLTAQRTNFTLIRPGEEFSFNKSVGEISRTTGYKTAYVIKDGMTQLGDGGGVCQVSTTIFRAALNAGLPITRWKPHSYRVGYYEQGSQPGFDATVYAPSTDFRFLNDTNHAMVVTTKADSENQHLVVEIWGKSDGRKSEISNYSIGNQRPAPATLYVDDPTLPRGTRKQIDWSAPGATTRFTYTVKNADGSERIKRDFISNFKPWRAVYLVGTQ